MARTRSVLVASVLLIATIGITLYVNAGSLTPPAGPVAPTMRTLDQLSAEIAAIQAGGGIKRVIRGVIDVPKDQMEETQTFSPSVDPAKCIVTLSEPVATLAPSSVDVLFLRNGACVMSLQPSALTVRVDSSNLKSPMKVGYQIIEYN